jgi:hypothetical protein
VVRHYTCAEALSFKKKEPKMLLQIVFILLCIGQLVYVSNRWFDLTKGMFDDARYARMRKAIDWKAVSPRR